MRRIKYSALALALTLALGTTAAFAHGLQGQGSYGQGMTQFGRMGGQGQMQPGMGGGQGLMQPGMGGQGLRQPGLGGQSMTDPGIGFGQKVVASKDLSTDDVRHFLEHRLTVQGNKRLQVGNVEEQDKDTIIAEIQTTDGSLVQRLKVDRHSGTMGQAQ